VALTCLRIAIERPPLGSEFCVASVWLESASGVPALAAAVGYAAQGGQTIRDDLTDGQVAVTEDACRPQGDVRE